METIIVALIASLFGPIFVAVVNHYISNKQRPVDKFDKLLLKVDQLANDQKKLEAKNDLWFLSMRHIDKPINFETFVMIRNVYGKYHHLGGNGEGTQIFMRLLDWYCECNDKDRHEVLTSCEHYFKSEYEDWK